MSAFTNDMESLILNHIFLNTDFTRPGTIYVALHDADPTDAGTVSEISGNAYARQPVVTGASSEWNEVGGGTVDNSGTIEFPAATPSDWGTITHVSLWNAVSGGTALFQGVLSSSKIIAASDIFRFDAGDLDIYFD